MHNDKEVKEDGERKTSSRTLFLSASLRMTMGKEIFRTEAVDVTA